MSFFRKSKTSLGRIALAGAWIMLAMNGGIVNGEPLIRRVTLDTVEGTAAVEVGAAALVHTTQLLPPMDGEAGPDAQLAGLLDQLDELLAAYDTGRDRLVKLNFYVADASLRPEIQKRLNTWCGGQEKLPAVCYVTTALPRRSASVAVDAVFAVEADEESASRPRYRRVGGGTAGERQSDACRLPPGDVVYIAGQAEPGELAAATRGTLQSLVRTLEHMGLDRRHIVQLKCFLRPMADVATVDSTIAKFFGDAPIPPVSHVEWISESLPIEIELIAWAPPSDSPGSVTYSTPPWMTSSPIFSRVARLHGDRRIYVSGLLAGKDARGREEVEGIFEQLGRLLPKVKSDMRHLAKATYYVAGDESSRALNEVRPSIYDPQRPPAASKAMVQGVAAAGREIVIDMIAAPAR